MYTYFDFGNATLQPRIDLYCKRTAHQVEAASCLFICRIYLKRNKLCLKGGRKELLAAPNDRYCSFGEKGISFSRLYI